MKKLFVYMLVLALGGCCTKMDCVYMPIESFVVSADTSMRGEIRCLDKITLAPVDSANFNLTNHSTNTSKYSSEVNSFIFKRLTKNLSDYTYIIRLEHSGSVIVDTIQSINYEKRLERSECNKCFLRKDYVEGFVYVNYVLTTSKLGKVYGQELKY